MVVAGVRDSTYPAYASPRACSSPLAAARATSAFTSARVDWPAGGFHCVASTAIAPVALARMDMAMVICLTFMMRPLLLFHELFGWSAARLMALAAFLISR